MVSWGDSGLSEGSISLGVSKLSEDIISLFEGDWIVLKSDFKVSRDLMSF